MRADTAGKLYSVELLALATSLANYPIDDGLPLHAEGRSRTCGSTIALAMRLDEFGSIKDIGMRVSACAVGQASAAILAKGSIGRQVSDVIQARDQLRSWLNGDCGLPDWPQISVLDPAREHAGRHGAILLSWNAAVDALSMAGSPS